MILDANKEVIDYKKLHWYNCGIDPERGIIGCLFCETNSHCDCMQTKKFEAHTMNKLEQCQGYEKYNLTGQEIKTYISAVTAWCTARYNVQKRIGLVTKVCVKRFGERKSMHAQTSSN